MVFDNAVHLVKVIVLGGSLTLRQLIIIKQLCQENSMLHLVGLDLLYKRLVFFNLLKEKI